jgi:probable rRNA maturation factor
LGYKNTELSVLITDDSTIRELNRKFRDKDKPTDVLSFPMGDEVAGRYLLGDIVISYETASRQATLMGHTVEEEIRRLLIHGFVHLLGYDHEINPEEEKRFFEKERYIEAIALRMCEEDSDKPSETDTYPS